MFGKLLFAAASVALLASPVIAAKPCHGPNGKFIKCPAAKPAPAVRCKAANGKFAKCGTPGAKPV
jgi:hypothetical protein